MKGFTCAHCGKFVPENKEMSTKNRNHCPFCLYSKHVDILVGDRKSECKGNMIPIGLTFKNEKKGKGELMLIHQCEKCGKISINRIAADDSIDLLMQIFEASLARNEIKHVLESKAVHMADEMDRKEIQTQLQGKQ